MGKGRDASDVLDANTKVDEFAVVALVAAYLVVQSSFRIPQYIKRIDGGDQSQKAAEI